VAAIIAGDPSGLADAYDRYAVPLHKFCSAMLREPADAADAVQDTFVIAASRLSGLEDRSGSGPGCTPWHATNACADCNAAAG